MSFLYNSAQPEAIKDSYSEYDNIDFVLNFENQMLVADSLVIHGEFQCEKANDATIQNVFLDPSVGIHSVVQQITVDTQNSGTIENLTNYPRFVRQYADVNYVRDDYFNGSLLAEYRVGSETFAKNMINSENYPGAAAGDKYKSFAFKPMCCLNRSVGVNKFISYDKTGSVIIRLRLAQNSAALTDFLGAANTPDYKLRNIKITYNTVPMMDIKAPVVMKSFVQLKQVVSSGQANINTRVPAVANGVSCSFVRADKENNREYNHLATERLPNVEEVIFMFNDSTNTYMTYPLRNQIEIQENYVKSLNETGHSELTRFENSKYGVGLKFDGPVDLRNQKFNIQIKSGVNSEFNMYMYFHSMIEI